jgi:hypothetical protein
MKFMVDIQDIPIVGWSYKPTYNLKAASCGIYSSRSIRIGISWGYHGVYKTTSWVLGRGCVEHRRTKTWVDCWNIPPSGKCGTIMDT